MTEQRFNLGDSVAVVGEIFKSDCRGTVVKVDTKQPFMVAVALKKGSDYVAHRGTFLPGELRLMTAIELLAEVSTDD